MQVAAQQASRLASLLSTFRISRVPRNYSHHDQFIYSMKKHLTNHAIWLAMICLVLSSCADPYDNHNTATQGSTHSYPPAMGFDVDNSDAEAVLIADEVMTAMGGYQNWQKARFFSWDFNGNRDLLWDKATGRVRIDIPKDSMIILVNVNDTTGRAIHRGKEISAADTLQDYLNYGVTLWINDSYWLVMPFKMKDSGVTLKYLQQMPTASGDTCDVVQLTFANVGKTPQNKYWVYVDRNEKLIRQWDYFKNASDSLPNLVSPWLDYQEYQGILLSGERGRLQLNNIQVLDAVADEKFEVF